MKDLKAMKQAPMSERPVVLFTGTRRQLTDDERKFIREDFVRFVPDGAIVMHGQCKTGVDAFVDYLAEKACVFCVRVPAPWEGMDHDRAAGMLRNELMAYQLQLYLLEGHSCKVLGYPSKSKGSGTQNMLLLVSGLEGVGVFMREFD